MFNTITIPCLLAAATCFLSPALHAEFTAVVGPDTGELYLLEDGQTYLRVGYYDWGPEWTKVKRSKTVEEGDTEATLRFAHTLVATQTDFEVGATWSQPSATTLQLEAMLRAEADSPITMAQFSLAPKSAFVDQKAVVTLADGTETTYALPFARGDLGEAVRSVALHDNQGRVTRLDFDEPESLNADRGEARMILAKDYISEAAPDSLTLQITLPESITFVPGVKAARRVAHGAADWYPFAAPSPIPADSALNMSSWLETPAGKHGRIIAEEDKLFYNGAPIKLWGINNSFDDCAPEAAIADKRADFYAAMGINSVRFHKYGDGSGWAGLLREGSSTEFDPALLDRMDYYVAQLKERGIYTKLSPVFIIDIAEDDLSKVPYADEFDSVKNGRVNPKHGSLYLSVELQDLLIEQVQNLFNHTNPYTGLRYADDPAIAYFELYNEDSALFGGLGKVLVDSPTLRARAGQQFAQWLKNKYDNEEAFLAAWGDEALNGRMVASQDLPLDESWEADRIYPAGNPWFFDPTNLNTSQQPFERRLLDTMAFLYELQNEVYARYVDAVRATGYEGEIIASNWQAGRMMSHFYNLHSDAMVGTIDRHNYFGGGQRRLGSFNNATMLSVPGSGSFSSSIQQVANRPFMLSEWIHVWPNEWGVEGPAIIGAYGMGLQGWDVSYAFQNGDPGTYSPALGTHPWDVTAPQFLGIFPAVSRQVLRGDVNESPIVHYRNVHIPSLDAQKVGFNEEVIQAWDEKSFTSDVFPAAALAAARGVVRFTEEFQPTEHFDLGSYKDDGTIRSATSQLAWHAGDRRLDGSIQIDTPGTQAVIGFAEGKTIELADSTIHPKSRYGAIYLSAQSSSGTLATDDAVLISAIARARNEGQIVLEDSLILSKGTIERRKPIGPVLMEPVVAKIELSRSDPATVHLLDHGGSRTGKTIPIEDGIVTIDTGRDATPYYLVEYK